MKMHRVGKVLVNQLMLAAPMGIDELDLSIARRQCAETIRQCAVIFVAGAIEICRLAPLHQRIIGRDEKRQAITPIGSTRTSGSSLRLCLAFSRALAFIFRLRRIDIFGAIRHGRRSGQDQATWLEALE